MDRIYDASWGLLNDVYCSRETIPWGIFILLFCLFLLFVSVPTYFVSNSVFQYLNILLFAKYTFTNKLTTAL